ncbi:MAG: SDR family NAD(P)-dependent oxidoreductase, partial [Microcoleus sp. SIO2G3]|nr:SDR family NAD(P)-dependent oxidoreductase [Microcoleus sp. SIO2G3]
MEKVIIITGGSRGIGAATACLAAERGYAVCVNYLRNQEAAHSVVSSITQLGGRAIAIAANVASENDVTHLFDAVDKQLGKVTALVNNAGILEQQMRVENIDAARLNRVFSRTQKTSSNVCREDSV